MDHVREIELKLSFLTFAGVLAALGAVLVVLLP